HSVSGAHETVETIAALRRVDVSIRENRDGLRRVIKRRIEVGEVVRLRVDRHSKLPAQTELETQATIHLPTVCHERFRLSEAEEAHRIECLLAVRSEVAEQCIGECVV